MMSGIADCYSYEFLWGVYFNMQSYDKGLLVRLGGPPCQDYNWTSVELIIKEEAPQSCQGQGKNRTTLCYFLFVRLWTTLSEDSDLAAEILPNLLFFEMRNKNIAGNWKCSKKWGTKHEQQDNQTCCQQTSRGVMKSLSIHHSVDWCAASYLTYCK